MSNEWYSRDISKKRRISNKIKGNSGEPMGPPPFGYMKDPDNPKRWIIDREAAAVVKKIFTLTLEGKGTEQIAAQLEREGVLTPMARRRKLHIFRFRFAVNARCSCTPEYVKRYQNTKTL